ncbi:MAG: hypothetical protein A2902_02755 [Elusimicrobia bacterium RIFCSPLOWO2_01_FULL_64_13]|nr:MAG: hypothetical protein A2902_02755 [Elusimicrobia bacterium RIFCSPLOWO2_01_FULL_64_13]
MGNGLQELSFYYEEMVRSNLLELEVMTAEGKIVLKRLTREVPGRPHPLRRRTDFLPQAPSQADFPPLPRNFKTVTCPISGIFYRSSSPQSPPFVKEGDLIEAAGTLCIVEAMKVMNEIKSEWRGRIVKILAENGKPVSKGQELFHVEPAT